MIMIMVSMSLLLVLWQLPSARSKVQINPLTHTFVEGDSELYFHGVNYVRKGAPYIADFVDCDATVAPGCPPSQQWIVTDADALELARKGMNVVRLGVMWPGMMPEGPDTINSTYLDQVERVVDVLYKRGVYTILDLHQDVLSPRLCGEGAPEWVQTTPQALGGLPFPLPLGLKPLPMLPSGLPNCSAAPTPIGWSSFYLSDTCGRAFEAIYTDSPPQQLGSQLAFLWSEVARRFHSKDAVIAYELLNEPWVGDSVEHPEFLLDPSKADLAQLEPFYRKLHTAIRQHDNDTVLLYSGMEIGDRLATAVGFTSGPGGAGYETKQGLVMHNYCAIGTDGAGPANGTQRAFCDVTDGLTFAARDKDAKRLRTALFMTEFGATSDAPTVCSAPQRHLSHVLHWFDCPSALLCCFLVGFVSSSDFCIAIGIGRDHKGGGRGGCSHTSHLLGILGMGCIQGSRRRHGQALGCNLTKLSNADCRPAAWDAWRGQ